MKKRLLLILPSLIQIIVFQLVHDTIVSFVLCCLLTMFQGGLCAWQRRSLFLNVLLSLPASVLLLVSPWQLIGIIYLLVLNGLAYFYIKTIKGIYQK